MTVSSTGAGRLAAFSLVAAALSTVGSACSSQQSAATTRRDARPTLLEVTLPDISSAAAPVQATLRERFTALTGRVADPATPTDQLALSYGDMGKLFLAAEYFGAAEASLSNAQALAPSDMRWPYFRGHAARAESDLGRAASRFGEALRVSPDHVPSLVWLAEMHLALGRAEEAKASLVKAQALAAREPAVLYGLGRVALEGGNYGQAVAFLEDALALAPAASVVRYPLALAYRGLGNRAKAEEHLRHRGEANLPPVDALMGEVSGLLQNTAALETRGSQAMADRQWTAAVSSFRDATRMSPSNAFTRLNLGTSLYMTGDRVGALEEFRTAVRLSPQLAKAHYAIGVLMEVEGKESEAVDAFTQAVAADAGYGEARLGLANALRRNGRVAESVPHYQAIVRADPGMSQAAFGHAIALVRLRRYVEARDRLEEGTRTFEDQPGFAHALARLLAAAPDVRVRNGAKALSLMEGLLKVQPQTLPMAETTAMALAELGRFDEALEWQRSAIAAAQQGGRQDLVASLTVNRLLYENRRPCRTPWFDDDPIHRPAPRHRSGTWI